MKTYTCKNCGKTYTEAIPKTGHNYFSAVTKDPTCTADGVKTFTCKNCSNSYTEAIPALEHAWEDITTKQWVVDKEAYDEEVETYKPYHQCTGCYQKWYYEAGNGDSNEATLYAWFDHCDTCPYDQNGYTTKYDVVIKTIHHDEEGHYEDTGHFETIVTGKKCTRCGLKETE